MSDENDWRSTAFRQRVVLQLDGLIRESATKTQRNAEELETQVYSRSTNRNEYLQYIGRVVMHLRRNLTHSGRQQLNRVPSETINFGLQNTGSLTGNSVVDQRNNLQNPHLSLPAWQSCSQINQIQGKNITLSKVAQNGEQFNIQMSIGNAGGGGGGGGSSQQHMAPNTMGDIQHRTLPVTNGINHRTPSPANGINQVSSPISMHHRTPSPAMSGLVHHRVPSPASAVMQHRTPSPAYEKSAPDIIVPTETEQWPRPMQISEDWKSWRTRQRVIQQLNDLIQQTPQTSPCRDAHRNDTRRDAHRLELQVFQRSKTREEYLQYIARIVMRLRQSAQGYQHIQNNHQTQGNTSQGSDPTQIAVLANTIPSNLPNRISNNVSSPEVISMPGINNNVASGSQTGNQTPLLLQSLQQLRQVKNSDDWKTRTFRQRIIHQLEELNRWTPATVRRSPEDLESQIFQRSNSKEDYMRYIGKVVLHMRQVKQANGRLSSNPEGNTSQSSSQSGLQSQLLGVQHPQVDLSGHDNHALSLDPQVSEQQNGNSTLHDVHQVGNGLTAGDNSSQLRELLSSTSSGECSSLDNVNHQSNLHINDFNTQAVEYQGSSQPQTNKSFDIQNETQDNINNRNDSNKEDLSINSEKTNTSNESEIEEYEKASNSPGAFQLLLLGD